MASSGISALKPADRYAATAGRVQLTGIQALARFPIDQHRRDLEAGLRVGTFISGYEGSPLAGYDLELARVRDLLRANEITFVPGLNEEASATAVQGTQLANTLDGATHDGVVGIWYGKAPGFDRAADAIRHGNLMGAHPQGGAILLVGDDPGAKSSSVPSSSDLALADLSIPFVYPADSADILDLGLHAVELSRVSGLWVGMKIVTAVADGSSTVDLAAQRAAPLTPDGAKRHVPTAHLLQPTLGRLERDLVTTRLHLAREYAQMNGLNRVVGRGREDRVGIVAAGRSWMDLLSALDRLGIGDGNVESSPVRLLKVGMPFPLDQTVIREFAEGLDEILVIEEKRSFMESAVRDVLYGATSAPSVTGKRDADGRELMPAYGELDVDVIQPRLRRRLVAHGIDAGPDPDRLAHVPAGRRELPLATRMPYFCSGCPHNVSTKPHGDSLVGGGIGCHAMVLLMDESQVGTVTGLTQMGGEGLQWIGMAPFLDRMHYVQNLGDGTFDHSGSLAIRAAVASGVNITYKLLYNSAVAMTGGQQAVGGMSVRQIVDVLLAEGVAKVIVTTEDRARYKKVRLPGGVPVWDRSRIGEAQEVLAKIPGVTVLVHDQECATEKRRRRKRGLLAEPQKRVVINERVCEGCGDCGRKSNCLSVQPVETEFGRKTAIHQASCTADYTCLTGDCPAFLTVQVPAGTKPSTTRITEGVTDGELPDPVPMVAEAEFGVRLTGIGGTGVVTVSQVLAMAGLVAGWTTRSLDQTGLAQKGGAVVSDVTFRRGGAGSNKLAAGQCDLYLGFDVLVAADPKNLAAASPERTVAVLSTAQVPTGRMVSDPDEQFPSVADISEHVRGRVRAAHVLDARALSLALFGDDQYANVFMVGVGFQSGALPLPAKAIEEAIRLNGVAVEANLQAFRRGRQYVADPDALSEAVQTRHAKRPADADADAGAGAGAETELDRLVRIRAGELTAYQNAAYATRYNQAVDAIRRAESAAVPGSTVLAEAVARNLFKLMAYKDEYEVARLSLDRGVLAEIRETFGAGARASWNLHPPALRALGMKRKIRLGPWFRPAFRVLYAMRRLRGTAFDPFGRARVRIVERELVREYLDLLEVLAHHLDRRTLDTTVALAELPDLVRGYEDVKLRNVERYRARMAELRSELDTSTAVGGSQLRPGS